ncbi:MAG: class I SAM-dependent methyltransferase [Campylobacteraceae bacterium]|nr:class I SAM-dependent methyltransferase [Campylobacteraceae bacterium]
MQEYKKEIDLIINEMYLIQTMNLDNKTILDLGCGEALISKELKKNVLNIEIFACEVDSIQLEKNIKNNELITKEDEKINYLNYPAQELKFENETFDLVFLFKSFHHIPVNEMKKALIEIKRVLKRNGLVYISEPLFQGKQNELVSIFHNEQKVREEAYKNIKEAVRNEEFKLFKEIFFNTEVEYSSYEDFKTKQMNLSYNEDSISADIYKDVKKKYEEYANNGKVKFLKPFRVNILQKI